MCSTGHSELDLVQTRRPESPSLFPHYKCAKFFTSVATYSSIKVLLYVPCDRKNVCAPLHKLTNSHCSKGIVGSSVEIINRAAKQERKLPTKKHVQFSSTESVKERKSTTDFKNTF